MRARETPMRRIARPSLRCVALTTDATAPNNRARRIADEELWNDGSFPHYMQRMTMKYGGEIS